MPEQDQKSQKPSWKDRLNKPATRYLLTGAIAAVVSVFLYMGIHYGYGKWGGKNETAAVLDNPLSAESKPPVSTAGTSDLKKTAESFRSISARVGPAVVNIKSTKGGKLKGPKGMARRRGPQMPDDEEGGGPMGPRDPFFDFFEQFRQGGPMSPQDMPPQTSAGSGILIDKKGIVVTNNHVVEDASEIFVTLNGEKTDLKAKLLGSDPKTDLAVLKIESNREFPAAEWADSDSIEVGDWAVAIGSPFALGQSVTVGIVSAKGRNSATVMGSGYGSDLIQTDAAINPGNSGGPLCDIEGRVMGVNTAIYTRSGGYMGIGFAIPSNVAKDIVGKLVKDGKVTRGWLGVLIQPLDPELAKELGVKDGVGIHEVLEGSPAANAGIKAGDVVVEVDGKAVKEVTELQRTIGGYKPGQTIKLKVVAYSDKKTRTVSVKIGELKDDDQARPAKSGKPQKDEPDRLGIIVGPSRAKDGAVIDYIAPGSIAEQSGLEVGDVVTKVNRKAVNTPEEYDKAVTSGKRFALEVKRKGRTLFYQFALPE